jgi:hypothetical protein
MFLHFLKMTRQKRQKKGDVVTRFWYTLKNLHSNNTFMAKCTNSHGALFGSQRYGVGRAIFHIEKHKILIGNKV